MNYRNFSFGAASFLIFSACNAALVLGVVENKSGEYIYGAHANMPSVADGEKAFMSDCEKFVKKNKVKNSCRVVYTNEGPGYFSAFVSVHGKPASLGYSFSDDRQAAINEASKYCLSMKEGVATTECPQTADSVLFESGPNKLTESQFAEEKSRRQTLQQRQVTRPATLEERVQVLRDNAGPRSGYSNYGYERAGNGAPSPFSSNTNGK